MALISLSYKINLHISYQQQPSNFHQTPVELIKINSPRSTKETGSDSVFTTAREFNGQVIKGMFRNQNEGKGDAAYHKEKMLLCKQEEVGVQLNAEQADWKDDTDDESEEHELEAHYIFAIPEFLKKAQRARSSSVRYSLEQSSGRGKKDSVMSTIVKGRKQEVEDHRRELVEIVLFIVDYGCSKHMTGNLKLLSNFVEKFLGNGQLGNDQICSILGYGDLVQGTDYFKRVIKSEGLNHQCFLRWSKDETPGVLIDFLTLVQRGLHAQVTTVQTDKGTEFLNKTLHAYFAKEGIRHETSTARTPKQNGIVERQNRTLVEAARTMLSAAKVPLFFWAEAITTAYFTQNRSLVIPQHEKTPYHIINARKPSVKFFHIFGSLCYIVRDGENLDKMKEKGDACIFVGYLLSPKLTGWRDVYVCTHRELNRTKEHQRRMADSAWIESMHEDTFIQFDRFRGIAQKEGLDFESLLPSAGWKPVWLFIAYAATNLFTVYQMVVKTTFLYGTYEGEAAIAISYNPVQHSRTKHIDVRYHFIKDHVKNGIVELFFVGTEYQLGDLFNKALSEDRFMYLVR
ncbi:retrovirus-related pol polyprotein from transposon TNT 1-94 [Tanacetum coccineum]